MSAATPDSPAAVDRQPARSAGRRWAWGVAAAVALLVGAVCLAEAFGWPFLAGPMQSTLSKLLDRPVYFEGAMTPGAAVVPASAGSAAVAQRVAGGVRVKLFGRIEVRAHRIEVAAPAWSKGAPLLVADDARLQLRYGDLWQAYRGNPLRVRRIEADRLDVRLERLADGRASWQFGRPSPSATEPVAVPVFEDMRVREGLLDLKDAALDSALSAKFSLVDGEALARVDPSPMVPSPAASAPSRPSAERRVAGLQAEATGRYRKLPLSLSLHTVGVLPWVAEDAARIPVPLTVNGRVGQARLHFDGSVRDLQRLAGLGGRFTLAGPSLAAVGDVIGVTLPTTASFSTRGILSKRGEVWSTRIDEALIGRSRLNAALRYDPTQPTPLLAGRVGGARLLLADLGPTIGTAPVTAEGAKPVPVVAKPGRVLPDREFDLPSLRAMNATVLLDFDELDLGTPRLQPLSPLRAHLVLDGGVLELRNVDARTADGRLQGAVSLDGRDSVAVWRTDLRWSQVKLEQWLKQERAQGAPPWVTGRLDGRARLEGRGRSTAQILGSLGGELRGRLREGTVSHLAVEAAGIDIAQGLGVFVRGDDALPMDCALADLRVERGVARPRVMVVDTRDSVIWVDGSLSLADESLDLRAVVAPRDFSPLALRTPVKVQGSLSDPKVSLAAGPLAGKLAAVGLLALINPLAGLLPLIDLGSDDVPANAAGGCRALAAKAIAQNPAKAKP